jgi:hypothetical protein
MRFVWIPTTVALCLLAGCITGQSGDPVLTAGTIETLDQIASVAEPLGQTAVSLSMLWPPLAVLGGLLGGGAGAWKRMKPKLEEATTTAEFATYAGEATMVALEEFKKSHPEEWGTLSVILREHHGPEVENFYRALRDLPPKG